MSQSISYPSIEEPPLLAGAVHENATDVEVVLAAIAVKAVGGSGTVAVVRLIVRENVKVLSESRLEVVNAFTLQV